MIRQFGDLLKPRVAEGQVSFSGPDANGIVTWQFTNKGNVTGSWLLQRGASLEGQQFEDYIFGQAFNIIYLNNSSAFGTSLLQAPPLPLIDKGTQNNAPPMSIIFSPNGVFIAFVFTLDGGQTWSMEEGGFSGGITPSNPILIPVSVKNAIASSFCDSWQNMQCQGYNQQAGTNLPCPSNPWQISSISMETTQDVPILITDSITSGNCSAQPQPSCIQQIEQGLAGGNIEMIVQGIVCIFETGALDVKKLIHILIEKL